MSQPDISATRAVAIKALAADRLAAELVHLFDDEAIPVVLLKGTPLARWLYPEGWVRPVADVDLLVPPHVVGRAGDLLEREGWARRAPTRRLVTHATTWLKPGVAFPVDLHTSFHFVTVPDERFWELLAAEAEAADIGDATVAVPSRRFSLMLLGLHASAGDGRAVDEFALAIATNPRELLLEALDLARRLGAEHAVAVSLRRSPQGVEFAEEMSLASSMPTEMALDLQEQAKTASGFVRLDEATTVAGLVRLLWREMVPSPGHMGDCFPRLAGAGRPGLVLAYLWRPFSVLIHARVGWRRWRGLRRRLDIDQARMGVLERAAMAGEIVHAYLGCRFELRRAGVAGALRWARRPVAASDPTDRVMQGRSVDIAAGIRLASITARALQRVPTDTRCLNQSLVLVRLLANRGVHAQLALAVRRHEVAAHAWVEVAGEAVSPLAPDGFVQVSTL